MSVSDVDIQEEHERITTEGGKSHGNFFTSPLKASIATLSQDSRTSHVFEQQRSGMFSVIDDWALDIIGGDDVDLLLEDEKFDNDGDDDNDSDGYTSQRSKVKTASHQVEG